MTREQRLQRRERIQAIIECVAFALVFLVALGLPNWIG